MPRELSIERSSARVRRARKRLGMTQKEFAVHVGVAIVTVQKWEQGHSRPTRPENVLKIMDALKAPVM